MTTRALRRFGFGLVLPIRLISAAIRDPKLGSAYIRTTSMQAGATVLLFATLCCIWTSPVEDLLEAIRERELHEMWDDLGTLLVMLYVSQWIVLALSKDYTDQLSRGVSLVSSLPPEDPERNANLRIDFRWMKKKLRRRVRAAYLYAVGIPAIALVSLPVGIALAWITDADEAMYSVLCALWAAYWAIVGVTSKTAYAWNEPPPESRPWFLRALERVERVPVASWYVRWVKKASSSVRGPTITFEKAPAPLAGLAFARALTAAPILSIAMRPVVPVAVAKILETEGERLYLSVASVDQASTS